MFLFIVTVFVCFSKVYGIHENNDKMCLCIGINVKETKKKFVIAEF